MLKQTITEDYNQDWPLHYHEIPTPALKKTYLLQHKDTERLEVFEKRYSESYADTFMSAWLQLKTLTTEPVHFFNRKLKEKQLRALLTQLCVLEYPYSKILKEEWQDFARTWITICTESSSYRSVAFGIARVSDKNTALRLCHDIDTMTRLFPESFHLEKECSILHSILVNTFIQMIENGQEYWEAYQSSI